MNTVYRVLTVCNAERASTLAANVTDLKNKKKLFLCLSSTWYFSSQLESNLELNLSYSSVSQVLNYSLTFIMNSDHYLSLKPDQV